MAEQVTLTLPDALAKRVRDVAALTQRDLEDVLLEWIDHTSLQLAPSNVIPTSEANNEAQLLQQVNIGFSEKWWNRYRTLISDGATPLRKEYRQSETISEQHLSELIEMSEALEITNVKRMKALGELAQLRGCSIEDVMDALDIKPKSTADA